MGAGRAHVVAVPYPAQGHLIPMIELAQTLAGYDIKVTIVNTELIHERMTSKNTDNELIEFAVIPDGMEPWEDRGNVGRMLTAMSETMAAEVEALIEKIENGGDEVACLIVDYALVWPFELAKKLKIKKSSFMTAPIALLAINENILKLVDEGIIDNNGTPLKKEMIKLSPEMPKISSMNFLWTCTGDTTTHKIMFHANSHNANSTSTMDWILCNSSSVLEPGALKLVPKALPIGPLLASSRLGERAGNFWAEDSACLTWLDQHTPNSVIYVAFGSSVFLHDDQFYELARGLELTHRPFLWVVRKDCDNAFPEGYEEGIKGRGKIVRWAPQQKVLSHPSVVCFMSHCGWNSTIEGVISGVPFLCWPHSADQFINRSYIVDYWGLGLGFDTDELGIIKKGEIKSKVEKILSNGNYRKNALELQAKTIACVGEGGSSHNNFQSFIDWIKGN